MRTTENIPIIGLTGEAGVGKDFVANRISEHGFIIISASDILREHITKAGLVTSRALQTEYANKLRLEKGDDYFARSALERAIKIRNSEQGVLISGLYAPAEGIYIKSFKISRLVEIVISKDDNPETRYSRISMRSDGPRDSISYEEFKASGLRENSGKNSGEANIGQLSQLSDVQIINNGDLDYLDSQIENLIGSLYV